MLGVEAGLEGRDDAFHQEAMLRHGEGVRALCLSVPSRHAGQAVGDVADLDIERGGVEEIETPPRQHALPGSRRRGCLWGAVSFGGIDLLISSLAFMPEVEAGPKPRMRRGDDRRRGGR